MSDIVELLFDLLAGAGSRRYGGEPVSQLQHALQSAQHAEKAGAAPALVAAALLHDIGHLIGEGDEGAAAAGVDLRHEDVGADYLARWFPPAVTEPIRLHVPAKRYLCATSQAYFRALSPASRLSLQVQGGPFDPAAAAAFAALPFAPDAIRLRRWDEAAKLPDHPTPPVAHYRPLVEGLRLA